MLWTAGITIIACALERWSLSVESVVLAKYPFAPVIMYFCIAAKSLRQHANTV
jgi:hypothetical protein